MTGMWRQELKRPASIPALPRPPLLLLIALRRWRLLFVGDPGDKQARPVFRGLDDLHADARGAVNCGRDAHHGGGRFGGPAVGPVRPNVEFLSDDHFLIEMEQRAGSLDVVSFGWFAPGSAIFRAA